MKSIVVTFAVVSVLATVACGGASSSDGAVAGSDSDLSKDACRAPAISAAEDAYGNAPDGTSVKVLTKGVKYRVTVGLRNPEDGPHDYDVTFPHGCSSKPSVEETPTAPHPLRDAAHTEYDRLLWDNDDKLPSSHAIAESDLPSAARKQANTWKADGASTCSSVTGYKVTVTGKDTYAVACAVVGDSIQLSFAVWDDSGGDIDQAAVYGLSSGVGDKGVSWQNETFEEQ